uniref:C2H2-type domain-containing protein n=1 Tax=Trypanosoma congolense (strain IL3000) TaxID=1068625 RepID=G0UTH4_TRYCI|nr:conserved hypothetical protein [Trypanosoma congolense IL3000]
MDTESGGDSDVEFVSPATSRKRRVRRLVMRCPYCSYTTERREGTNGGTHLKRHLLTHTKERPYKCHICPAGFTTSTNRKRHIAALHPEVAASTCSGAATIVSRKGAPAASNALGTFSASSGEFLDNVTCRFCNITLSCKGERTRHERHCPARPSPAKAITGSLPSSVSSSNGVSKSSDPGLSGSGPSDEFFLCPNCEQELADRVQLRRHLKRYCPFREEVFMRTSDEEDDAVETTVTGGHLRAATRRSRIIVSRRCAGLAENINTYRHRGLGAALSVSAAEVGLHTHSNNVKVICPYDNCVSAFASHERWLRHVARCHPHEFASFDEGSTMRLGLLTPR